MTTEPAENPDSNQLSANKTPETAPQEGESPRGPLAAFKRNTSDDKSVSPPPTPDQGTAGSEVSASKVPQATGRGSRSKGDRPRRGPRSDQQAAENAEVDRSLAADRQAKRDPGPRPAVPVPNRRHRSEELEAEVAAALGDMSLDEIVSDQAKLSGERLENDSRHRAQVAEVFGDNVFFSLGGKNQGVASIRSFPEPPQPGDMIDVVVRGFNPEDNLYDLSIPGGAIVVGDWSEITEGSLVEAKITGSNTGGLECQVKALRGFIPASQVALYRIENFGDFVGQTLVCVVTESNERRGNLVLSRRAVLEREKEESKRSLMKELEPGQMREGTVRKIQDFGAFVDLGGVDGLIHISQLSWERVKHPSEVLHEGQKVRVRVEKIDPETGKIGLSLKNPEEHPWTGIEQKFPVGSTVRGPVSRIAQFGAFVKLAPGVEGLIHISELAHHKIYRVENVVKEGEEVECKVLSMDTENQRIGLSLKATLAKPEKESSKPKDEPEVDEPPRAPVVPKRAGPLKGGAGKSTGGEQFGLKW